jgi:hypothetical protein
LGKILNQPETKSGKANKKKPTKKELRDLAKEFVLSIESEWDDEEDQWNVDLLSNLFNNKPIESYEFERVNEIIAFLKTKGYSNPPEPIYEPSEWGWQELGDEGIEDVCKRFGDWLRDSIKCDDEGVKSYIKTAKDILELNRTYKGFDLANEKYFTHVHYMFNRSQLLKPHKPPDLKWSEESLQKREEQIQEEKRQAERKKMFDEIEEQEKEFVQNRMTSIRTFYDKIQSELAERDLSNVRVVDLMKLYLQSGQILQNNLREEKGKYRPPSPFDIDLSELLGK